MEAFQSKHSCNPQLCVPPCPCTEVNNNNHNNSKKDWKNIQRIAAQGRCTHAAEATCEGRFADSSSAGTSASPGMFWHPCCYTSSRAGRWAFWLLLRKSHLLLCRFSSTTATICLCSINDNSLSLLVCMSDSNTQPVCSSSLFSPSPSAKTLRWAICVTRLQVLGLARSARKNRTLTSNYRQPTCNTVHEELFPSICTRPQLHMSAFSRQQNTHRNASKAIWCWRQLATPSPLTDAAMFINAFVEGKFCLEEATWS